MQKLRGPWYVIDRLHQMFFFSEHGENFFHHGILLTPSTLPLLKQKYRSPVQIHRILRRRHINGYKAAMLCLAV